MPLDTSATPAYGDLTRWESRAGGGPLLRGRHAPGRAATIHFIPGNGFCGGVYWPFLKRFLPERATAPALARGYGLFTHDIEGHGDSEAPAHFSGIGAVARRVPQVAGEQGLAAPLVGMGHSFGAALTLKVAADNPGLFQALVLLDPIVFPTPVWLGMRAMAALGLHPMTRAAQRRRREWASRADVPNHLRGRGIYRGWTEEALECFVDYATKDAGGRRVLSCPPELEAEIYERPVYPWPSFRNVKVPILFLYGADSYPFFAGAARLARRANPGVEVSTAPGQHCFMLEDPAAAHRVVTEFLNKNRP
jgi:pimeloyl-ACP methyl ester carboxylesterase